MELGLSNCFCTRKEDLEASACCAAGIVITLPRALIGYALQGATTTARAGNKRISSKEDECSMDAQVKIRCHNAMIAEPECHGRG